MGKSLYKTHLTLTNALTRIVNSVKPVEGSSHTSKVNDNVITYTGENDEYKYSITITVKEPK